MPSIIHESLVDLFRECPVLASELLSGTGAAIPDQSTPRITSAEFVDLNAAEYRADVVICLDTADREPAEAIIVEIQLDRDTKKRKSWPLYMAGVHARFDCLATLLVIAIDDGVSAWCAQPIPLDHNGSVVRPVVLGPHNLPRITDLDHACILPELAVLSVAAHGNEVDAAEIAMAALGACEELDSERSTRYADFVHASLNESARHALETLMSQHNYNYQSEFARRYLQQGVEQGVQKVTNTLREVLLGQLAQRFGEISESVQKRIEQAELEDLQRWSKRVIPATTITDVFLDD